MTIVELSSRVEYALLALLELADQYDKGNTVKIGDIAARHSLPERYLEQILTSLRREGMIQSQRGAKGGYILTREPWQITLLEIVMIVEGDSQPKEGNCESLSEKNVVYEIWQQVNHAQQTVLSGYTLKDLCDRVQLYRQVNPMYYI